MDLKRAFAHDKTELPNYNFFKSLYLSSPEPKRFLTKITAPAPAKYGGSTTPGSETLLETRFVYKLNKNNQIFHLIFRHSN